MCVDVQNEKLKFKGSAGNNLLFFSSASSSSFFSPFFAIWRTERENKIIRVKSTRICVKKLNCFAYIVCKEYWAAAQEIKSLDKKMRLTKSKAFLLLYAIQFQHTKMTGKKKKGDSNADENTGVLGECVHFW